MKKIVAAFRINLVILIVSSLSYSVLAQWSEPVQLTQGIAFSDPNAIAIDSSLHVVGSQSMVYFHYLRSTDDGITWSIPAIPSPADTFYGCGMPFIISSNDKLHMVWKGSFSGPEQEQVFHISSTDGGITWSAPHQMFNNRSNYMRYPRLAAKGDTLFACVMIDENLVSFRSFDSGVTWRDSTVAEPLAAGVFNPPTILYSSGRVHLIYQMGLLDPDSSAFEIWHRYSTNFGRTWSNRVALSTWPDHIHGQAPSASSDSTGHLMAAWFDYKYGSYCEWSPTGDILTRTSTDNGTTWLPEGRVTFTQSGWATSSIIADSTIHLVWQDFFPFGCDCPKTMYAQSTDWGITWSESELISGPDTIIEQGQRLAYTAVNDTTILHCFIERVNSIGGNLFYFNNHVGSSLIREYSGLVIPNKLSISAYPNPFNSSVLLTINNPKGGELGIRIYDIQGRIVKSIDRGDQGGDEKIVWDATDASGKKVSSGIYFARASTAQTEKTIKLLYIK